MEGLLNNEMTDVKKPRVGRWVIVILLALPLVASLVVLLWGLLTGTWSINAGVPIPEGVSERVAAARETVAAAGTAPEAVVWLDEALKPHADGADILACILAALEDLEEANDPRLTGVITELRGIAGELRTYSPQADHTPIATLSAP